MAQDPRHLRLVCPPHHRHLPDPRIPRRLLHRPLQRTRARPPYHARHDPFLDEFPHPHLRVDFHFVARRSAQRRPHEPAHHQHADRLHVYPVRRRPRSGLQFPALHDPPHLHERGKTRRLPHRSRLRPRRPPRPRLQPSRPPADQTRHRRRHSPRFRPRHRHVRHHQPDGGGANPTIGEVIQTQCAKARNQPFGAALGVLLLAIFIFSLWATTKLRRGNEE